jgi:hypothetical protein
LAAPVRKFTSCPYAPENNRAVLLQLDGTMQVLNLEAMAVENQIRTFALNPLLLDSGKHAG